MKLEHCQRNIVATSPLACFISLPHSGQKGFFSVTVFHTGPSRLLSSRLVPGFGILPLPFDFLVLLRADLGVFTLSPGLLNEQSQ
jgi:hypothetical protein